MNYTQYKRRQELIDQQIKIAENEKMVAIQSGLNDPFQTYYYQTPIEDPNQIHKIKQKITQKIIQQANLQRIQQIEQQLRRQLYVLEQKIKIQELQNESVDFMIKNLESQLHRHKVKREAQKFKDKQEVAYKNTSIQTDNPKYKQTATNCESSEKLSKQSKRYLTPVYSLIIQNCHQQNQKPKQVQAVNKKQKKAKQQNKTKKPKGNENAGACPQNIENIFSQLKKQMEYLKYLKAKQHKKEYRTQKQKVKYLIEFFWKNAQNSSTGKTLYELNLPLLQF